MYFLVINNLLTQLVDVPLANLIVTSITIITCLVVLLIGIKSISFQDSKGRLFSLTGRNKDKVVRIVVDYADFKYKVLAELNRVEKDLKNRARRIANMNLDIYYQHINDLYQEYVKKRPNTKNKNVNYCMFRLMTYAIRPLQTECLMKTYEHNHLTTRTDKELKDLSRQIYLELTSNFRSLAQAYWVDILIPYEEMTKLIGDSRNITNPIIDTIILEFRKLSAERKIYTDKVSEFDNSVRSYVIENGKLPDNSIIDLENIYRPGLDEIKEI